MRTYMDQEPWNNPHARDAIGAPDDAPFGTLDDAGRLAVFRTAGPIPTAGYWWWSTLPPDSGSEADAATLILRGWVDPDAFARGYRIAGRRPWALIPVAEVHDLEGLAPSVAASHRSYPPREPCHVWRVEAE